MTKLYTEIRNVANAKMCLNHLRKEPELSENLIVAMLANIAVETGGTFDYKTKQKGRLCPAVGLFQYDPRGGLLSLYKEYLDLHREEDSAEAQLNMMVDILLRVWKPGVNHVGSGNVTKVMRAAEKSADEATRAFSEQLLRPGKPHMERRLAAAGEAEAFIRNVKSQEEQA